MKRMKNVLVMVMCLFALVSTSACIKWTLVQPGYVGVKVNLTGSQRGVSDLPVVTGRVWYNPFYEQIDTFPTFIQVRRWTKDEKEGATVDESISFNSTEGAPINADVAVAFTFEAKKIPNIYVEFRQDADYIADVYLRNKVREVYSSHGPEFKAVEIVGTGSGRLNKEVKDDLNQQLKVKGIQFDSVSIIGRPRIPSDIEKSINNAIKQSQDALAAGNKVAEVTAEALQAVARAKGQADSQIQTARGDAEAAKERAQGKADATLLEMTAEAKGNNLVAQSLTPLLIKKAAIEAWKGDVPKFAGSNVSPVPFIDLNKLDQ